MKLHIMVLGSALLLLGADPSPEAVQKEMAVLQGTWKITTAEQDGQADKSLKDATVTIGGDYFTTRVGDKPLRHGTLRLDPTKKPKTIDLIYADGPQKGKTSQGIYNLHRDSWILFFSIPGKDRPAKFDRRVTIGQMFMVLRKAGK